MAQCLMYTYGMVCGEYNVCIYTYVGMCVCSVLVRIWYVWHDIMCDISVCGYEVLYYGVRLTQKKSVYK